MDLFVAYLLIVLVLFSANLALLLGNFKLDNVKIICLAIICAVITFILINISQLLKDSLFVLLGYFNFIFLIIAIIIFAVMVHYIKKEKTNLTIYLMAGLSIISIVLLSSQADLMFFDTILYSLFVLIALFFVYQISKLLIHAKRPYPIIIGEFMSLFAILIFIFALTYVSTWSLDYTMFRPFLILTPLYQLIYFIIGIAVVIVVGVLLNESNGGNS